MSHKSLSAVVIEDNKLLVDEDLLGRADEVKVFRAKYRLDDEKIGTFTIKEAIEIAKKEEKFLIMIKDDLNPNEVSIITKEDLDFLNRMLSCRIAADKSYERYGFERIEAGKRLISRWYIMFDTEDPFYLSELFKGRRELTKNEVNEICHLMFDTFWYFRSKESPREFYNTDLTLALILEIIEIMWRRSYSDAKFTFSLHARAIVSDLGSGCPSYYGFWYHENNVGYSYDLDPGPCSMGGIDFSDYESYRYAFESDCENADGLMRQLMAACEEAVYDYEGYENYE